MSDSINSVAIIGEPDIITIFKSIGYDCFYEIVPDKIIEKCKELTEKNYKIILITEKEAQKIEGYLNSRERLPYPIILPVPDTVSDSSYGLKRLGQNMEKAMGIKTGGKI